MKLARPKPKVRTKVILDIVEARRVADFKLRVRFSDGASRTIDFKPFLDSSKNPMIRAYLDRKRFAQFRIEDGNLMWGDYELCFPVVDLYENRL